MRNSGFARKRPPRPDRSGEFASFVPKPRPIAPAVYSIQRLDTALPEPAAPLQPAAAAREHMGRVAGIGCLLCGMPAEVHHLREGQGMAQRASDWLTVPLCAEHHRGKSGLHGLGVRAFERRYRMSELDLLAMTIARLRQ
jgi:hypothetical protein